MKDRLLLVFDDDEPNDYIEDRLSTYTSEGWTVTANELKGDKRFIYIELPPIN